MSWATQARELLGLAVASLGRQAAVEAEAAMAWGQVAELGLAPKPAHEVVVVVVGVVV